MLKYDEIDRISWEDMFIHPVLMKKYDILVNYDDLISDSDKNNPIF